jgi:hypothetical protein
LNRRSIRQFKGCEDEAAGLECGDGFQGEFLF